MIYDWYNIVNKTEFEASGLVSQELELNLEGVGQKSILVTKGNLVSLVVDGIIISLGLSDANPFAFGGYAIYLDASNNVWLGIPTS